MRRRQARNDPRKPPHVVELAIQRFLAGAGAAAIDSCRSVRGMAAAAKSSARHANEDVQTRRREYRLHRDRHGHRRVRRAWAVHSSSARTVSTPAQVCSPGSRQLQGLIPGTPHAGPHRHGRHELCVRDMEGTRYQLAVFTHEQHNMTETMEHKLTCPAAGAAIGATRSPVQTHGSAQAHSKQRARTHPRPPRWLCCCCCCWRWFCCWPLRLPPRPPLAEPPLTLLLPPLLLATLPPRPPAEAGRAPAPAAPPSNWDKRQIRA